MKMNSLVLGIFAAMILAVGIVSALPAGATISGTGNTTWNSDGIDSITVQGGYIYPRNLHGVMQTMKWAAIYGDATGQIVLANASGTSLYEWPIDSITNGHAIFTENDAPAWSSLGAGTAAEVDSTWSFGSASDNATNTFNATESDTINAISATVPVVKTYKSTGENYWETYLWKLGSGTAKDNFVFAGKVHDNEDAFDGTTADFQALVPVEVTGDSSTETYYAYVELE